MCVLLSLFDPRQTLTPLSLSFSLFVTLLATTPNATQICLAVQYLHAMNILHRDLKTDNIFLMDNDLVKLGDFGLAQEMQRSFAVTVTGTPNYVSPEIVKGLAYDRKTDIWSLGVILCELCSRGGQPFNANQGLMKLFSNIVNAPEAHVDGYYSEDLRDLYHGLLSKAPADRPSIDDVLDTSVMRKVRVGWR